METVHLVVGIGVLVSNLGAGGWGAYAWYSERPSVGFWYALRFAQAIVVVQILLGLVLVMSERVATDDLHYLYGALPLLVSLLAEGARSGVADHELEGLDFDALPEQRRRGIALAISRRETGIMAVSALVVFFLALRAALLTPAL